MAALIIVDVQNDFLPGGALAVPEGDKIIERINHLQTEYEHVIATMDWHPPDHCSFASNNKGTNVGDTIEIDSLPQIMWPEHCVQGSFGASFASELDIRLITEVIHKGTNLDIDSYSGFFDNHRKNETSLHQILSGMNESNLNICGLATDYCVLYTVLDAISLGYTVRLHCDAIRGVNLHPKDVENALHNMEQAGATLLERP